MNFNIHKLVIAILLALALFPTMASATDVDYDAVDEAALPMAAQTSVPQASDQFCRAYRQLLIYDYEEYSNDYDYGNLEGSLVAGSAVLCFGEEDGDYGFWAGSLAGYAQLNLGYDVSTPKYAALTNDNAPLASTWQRIGAAYSSGWGGFVWCMKSGFTLAVGAAVVVLRSVGALIAGATGALCTKAGAVLGLGYVSVCIAIGSFHWWKTLFFGSLLIGAGGLSHRRRTR